MLEINWGGLTPNCKPLTLPYNLNQVLVRTEVTYQFSPLMVLKGESGSKQPDTPVV